MTTEVLIYSPLGVPLCDINVVPVASRIINDVGDASFDLSLEDAAALEVNLQFGNVLVINHDTLPSWVGFIDSAQGREWGAGTITVRALSAESIFHRRIVYPTILSGTNGAILKRMLENMMRYSDGGIKLYPGDIYMGGRRNFYPRLGRCLEVIERLAHQGKCDWSVTHEVIKGRLRLYANLYQGERGRRTKHVLDARSTELSEPIYAEEGEIWNHVVFWRTGTKRVSRAWRDETSIGIYGLNQYLGEANTDEEVALEWMARAWLYDHAYPRGMIMPTIINYENIFKSIELGNKYRWEHHGVKFPGGLVNRGSYVRLTGYEVDYGAEKISAVVESAIRPFDITQLFNE